MNPANQCNVKILLLIFSPRKRAFVGLIPIDQVHIHLNPSVIAKVYMKVFFRPHIVAVLRGQKSGTAEDR